jgi:hypothetical protein
LFYNVFNGLNKMNSVEREKDWYFTKAEDFEEQILED